jgi:anthranilate phosphoribosyltransferase
MAADRVTAPEEGIAMAAEAIDSGRALNQMKKLAEMTNS